MSYSYSYIKNNSYILSFENQWWFQQPWSFVTPASKRNKEDVVLKPHSVFYEEDLFNVIYLPFKFNNTNLLIINNLITKL